MRRGQAWGWAKRYRPGPGVGVAWRWLPSVLLCWLGAVWAGENAPQQRNLILLLSDDHRYDFLGGHTHAPAWLETPNLDRLARGGARLANAFVTTSLCSPSRASILTGRYMHRHRVVDNQRPEPPDLAMYPAQLERAGYQTALFGKWHMGHDSDAPRPGFTHWAAFRGQGDYQGVTLNMNGTRQRFEGYNSDVLTDQALAWLEANRQRPFYLHLGFKSVHFPFEPAPRHRGRYATAPIPYPDTMANTEANYATQPRWVRDRRYGIHGIDHMETGRFDRDPVPEFEAFYRSYCEAIYSLDEAIGRVLDWLGRSGLASRTLVLYTSDNGFALGEHGFYDKRDAFEPSIRVPLLAWAPGLIQPGLVLTQMVQNIDLAPTFLEAAGAAAPAGAEAFDGRSFYPLLLGQNPPWRDHILYEYHWEWNFPSTPTTFALRTDRFKYVFYHGIWDRNGFYDLATDPSERHNLIDVPAYQAQIDALQTRLFRELDARGGLAIPVVPPAGERLGDRKLPR
ncbi:MAG: sulfatase [Verrucomicrobia bacterium]|nr:sulfatase [Verrucomicrobiota bacterium]